MRTGFLILSFCLSFFAVPLVASERRAVIRVGSELDFRPYAFVDENGSATGFSADLIRAVAEKMGLQLEITVAPWDEVWEGLLSGRFDVLPTVAPTPGRENLVDFSTYHTESFDAFFRKAGQAEWRSLADAKGKEVVVLNLDAAHHQLMERHFEGTVIPVESIPDGLRLVAAGKHDAFLCPTLIGELEIKQAGIKGLKPGAPIPDYKRLFSFAVRKGNAELLAKLNQGLLIVETNGEYDRIYDRWLGRHDPWQRIQRYLGLAMAIIGALGIACLIQLILLERLVRKRTRDLRIANQEVGAEIAERRKAEASLQQLNATLEQRIAERTEELRRFAVELEGANQSLRDSQRAALNLADEAVASRETLEQANAALRQSEQKFATLFHRSPHCKFLTDSDTGKVVEVNDAWCRLTGFTYPELVHRSPVELGLLPAEVWDGLTSTLPARKGEVEIRTKDGEFRTIAVSMDRMPDGSRPAVIWSGVDITERKRAEAQLHLQSVAMQAAANGIMISGCDGTIQWVNNAFVRLTGYSVEETIGQNPRLLNSALNPESLFQELWGTVLSGRPWHGELINKRKDESLYTEEMTITPVISEEGAVTHFIAIKQDVTERKQAEEALRWNALRSELLSQTAARLLESGDPQGLVEELCRRVMEVLDCQAFFNFLVDPEVDERLHLNAWAGIPDEEARKIQSLDFGVAVCGCVARDGLRMIAEDIANTPDLRTDLIRSYGIQAYCCHPLKVQDQLIGTLSFGTRTRKQFKAEEVEVMHAVSDLVAMAMHRIRTEEALGASLREKEVLLKEIHHRVKNNMQVISSLASLQAGQLKDSEVHAALQDMSHRVRSMAMVHERLYESPDLARIEFAGYARNLLDYLWRAYRTPGKEIRLSFETDPLQLPVDVAVPCGLVLNELAANALKHAFPDRERGNVIVSLHGNGDGRVSLGVRDDGVGLPQEFDWQNPRSLGLRLVQMLARQLGAVMKVTIEDGTEFGMNFQVNREERR